MSEDDGVDELVAVGSSGNRSHIGQIGLTSIGYVGNELDRQGTVIKISACLRFSSHSILFRFVLHEITS